MPVLIAFVATVIGGMESLAALAPFTTTGNALSCAAGFELGLLIFYVGMFSNVLEITPPLILTQAEAAQGVSILDQAISDVEAGVVSDEVVAPFAGG